jgi:bifunctional DNase/RNase
MIEVTVDSIRVSLMNQQRLVVLKDTTQDRYLPIWIGQFEAEAITIELQEAEQKRPLTHDLLKSTIAAMGGKVVHILINDLRNDIFYARVVIELAPERQVEVDARPSDAIALAVRTKSPIFVSEAVMDKSAVEPEPDVTVEEESPKPEGTTALGMAQSAAREDANVTADEPKLPSAFASFLDELLDDEEDK